MAVALSRKEQKMTQRSDLLADLPQGPTSSIASRDSWPILRRRHVPLDVRLAGSFFTRTPFLMKSSTLRPVLLAVRYAHVHDGMNFENLSVPRVLLVLEVAMMQSVTLLVTRDVL